MTVYSYLHTIIYTSPEAQPHPSCESNSKLRWHLCFFFQIRLRFNKYTVMVNGRPVEFTMFAEQTLSRARASQEGGIRQIYGLF